MLFFAHSKSNIGIDTIQFGHSDRVLCTEYRSIDYIVLYQKQMLSKRVFFAYLEMHK